MVPLPDAARPDRPTTPGDAHEIAVAAAELVACGSLEMGADAYADTQRIAGLLPADTPVYVNHLPRRELAHTLPALIALAQAGLEPVPHIAARCIASRREAEDFLRQAARLARVRKVLLIGGDTREPRGPYPDGSSLLRDRLLADCGMRQVGLPGYPEGHPFIAPSALAAALVDKLSLAEAQGLSAHIVTQFTFAPNRIIEYCADVARRAPGVPIYVGLPGPTSPRTLLRYAQRCGVGASLRALQAQGMGAVRLFTYADPADQLTVLARHLRSGSASNAVGVHLFSFGGVAATASWMNDRITFRTT
jgi:methylenetetrahydrofolate reductase (NADPH)